MTAEQLVENHILLNQNEIVSELIKNDILKDDYFFTDEEVLEWWLITPFFANCLRRENEVVISDLNCNWWGRTVSGQAIHVDSVISDIAKRFN